MELVGMRHLAWDKIEVHDIPRLMVTVQGGPPKVVHRDHIGAQRKACGEQRAGPRGWTGTGTSTPKERAQATHAEPSCERSRRCCGVERATKLKLDPLRGSARQACSSRLSTLEEHL